MSDQITAVLPNNAPVREYEKESEEKQEEDERPPFALSSHFSFSSMLRLEAMKPNVSQQKYQWIKSHNFHELPIVVSSSSHQAHENQSRNLSLSIPSAQLQSMQIQREEEHESSFENLLEFIGTCPSLMMDLSSTSLDQRWMNSTILPSLISSSTNTSIENGQESEGHLEKLSTKRRHPLHQSEQTNSTLHHLDGHDELNPLLLHENNNSYRYRKDTNEDIGILQQDQNKSISNQIYALNRHDLTLSNRCCSYPVSSMILSDTCFQISMTLWNTNIMNVLGILSDPNAYPLWYHPLIRSVVIITDEKGGTSEQLHEFKDRQVHDGLWIEATTTRLTPPTTNLSLLYNCIATFRTCLGCPSSGTIQLFVERNRGHVGFTIGKFHGGKILSHSILLQEGHDDGTVYLVDTIHIQQEEGEAYRHTTDLSTSHGSSKNGVIPSTTILGELLFHRRHNNPWFGGFYAPSLHDFLHQTVRSFKSLGLLIYSRDVDSEIHVDKHVSFIYQNHHQQQHQLTSDINDPIGLHSPLLEHVY